MIKAIQIYVVSGTGTYGSGNSRDTSFRVIKAFYSKQSADAFVKIAKGDYGRSPNASYSIDPKRADPLGNSETAYFVNSVPIEAMRDESYEMSKFQVMLSVFSQKELEILAVVLDQALETVRPTG